MTLKIVREIVVTFSGPFLLSTRTRLRHSLDLSSCQPGSGCITLSTFLCVNQDQVVSLSRPFFVSTRRRLYHSLDLSLSTMIRLRHSLDLSLCQPGSCCDTLWTFLCVNQDQVVALSGPFFVSARIRLWHSLDLSLCQPGSGLWHSLDLSSCQP